jgi:hypothetical protein
MKPIVLYYSVCGHDAIILGNRTKSKAVINTIADDRTQNFFMCEEMIAPCETEQIEITLTRPTLCIGDLPT